MNIGGFSDAVFNVISAFLLTTTIDSLLKLKRSNVTDRLLAVGS